jgi:hypothetical protein
MDAWAVSRRMAECFGLRLAKTTATNCWARLDISRRLRDMTKIWMEI